MKYFQIMIILIQILRLLIKNILNIAIKNMQVKYLINRLETILKEKYPEMTPEIYYLRRKKLLHLTLEKSIDQYPNYLMFLKDIESFFNKNFKNEFEFCRSIKIVHTIKWKFDYIKFRKRNSN